MGEPETALPGPPVLEDGPELARGSIPLAPDYLAYDELDVVELAKSLGVRSGVAVTRASPKHGNPEFNWSWNHNERDTCRQQGLGASPTSTPSSRPRMKIFSAHSGERWPLRPPTVLRRPIGRTRPPPGIPCDPRLVHQLTSVPWVLDKFGNLNLPQDIDLCDLDEALLEVMPVSVEESGLLAGTRSRSSRVRREGCTSTPTKPRLRSAGGPRPRRRRRSLASKTLIEAERFKAAREKDPDAYARFLEEAESPEDRSARRSIRRSRSSRRSRGGRRPAVGGAHLSRSAPGPCGSKSRVT